MRFIITIAIVFISFALSNRLFTGHTNSLEKRSPTGADLLIALKTGSRTNANSHKLLPDELEAVNAMMQVAQTAAFNYISPTTNIPTVLPNEPTLLLERIPKYVLTDRLLPFLNFDDAINLKGIKEFDLSGTNSAINTLNFREEQIIQHYSSTEPDAVVRYIFKDLDSPSILDESRLEKLNLFLSNPSVQRKIEEERQNNLFEKCLILGALQRALGTLVCNGRLELLKLTLMNHRSEFGNLDIPSEDIAIAAERGHKEMVEWVLEDREYLGGSNRINKYANRFAALMGSIEGKKFDIFKFVVDIIGQGFRPLEFKKRIKVLKELANENLTTFIDYFFFKICNPSQSTSRKNYILELLKIYVMRSSLRGGNKVKPSLEMLNYIFIRQEWNNAEISFFLKIMSQADYDVLERLGKEFLNTRVQFYQSRVFSGKKRIRGTFSGLSALDAAIDIVSEFSSGSYKRVKEVLKNIKKTEIASYKRKLSNHNVAPKSDYNEMEVPITKIRKHNHDQETEMLEDLLLNDNDINKWDSFVLWDF